MTPLPKLSICIPTYNREADLRECISRVAPQIEALPAGLVELVIVNNASTDGTRQYLDSLQERLPYVRVFHNQANLGFDGNTVKCLDYANGEYTALLSDDDRYLDGTLERVIAVIASGEFSLVYLNYYGFLGDLSTPVSTVMPEVDRRFDSGIGIMSQPGVGHYSGFIFRTELSRRALRISMERRPEIAGTRSRCVFLEVAFRVTRDSSLPSFLIGKRFLATKIDNQDGETYLSLPHLTLETCEIFEFLSSEGLIDKSMLRERYWAAAYRVPTLAVRDAWRMKPEDVKRLVTELDRRLLPFPRYRFLGRPLMRLGCFGPPRLLYRWIYNMYRRKRQTATSTAGLSKA